MLRTLQRAFGLLGRRRKRGPRDNLRVQPDPTAPVSVHVLGRNSLDLLRARDISMTGLGIFVPHRFEGCDIESDVELIVTLPGEKSFKARAQVKHRNEGAVNSAFFGVQFTALDPRNLEQLRHYVEERSAQLPA